MRRRTLARSGLELSEIGLGTWVFGGRWGGAEDGESLAACHAAIEAGINWIDTADIYGQGRAERLVGRVLAEHSRDDILVSSKGGVAWDLGPPLTIWREAHSDYLRMALDRSLAALGVDTIDIYHVHWPVPDVAAEDTIGALVEMRDAGKIRAIAVSNYGVDDLAAAQAVAPIDAHQVGYHLFRSQIEDAELPWAAANDVGVLAYGPLGHGLFTGKMGTQTTFGADDWRGQSEFFTDDAFPDRIAAAGELRAIAAEGGRAGGLAELAVAWVLRRPEVTSAIIGARNAAQAWANAKLAGAPLTEDETAAIDAVLERYPQATRAYGHGEPPARAGHR